MRLYGNAMIFPLSDILFQSTRMYRKYVNEPPLYKPTSQADMYGKMNTSSSYQNLDYRKTKGKENDDRYSPFLSFVIFCKSLNI